MAEPEIDPPPPAREWMTDREVCAFLRIALSTLRYWRKAGNAPRYYRLGERSCITKRVDVDAWLAERLVHPADKEPDRG